MYSCIIKICGESVTNTQWYVQMNCHNIERTCLGRLSELPHFSIVNFLGPLLPRSALKPSNGILEVPVTNCNIKVTVN